MVCVNCKHCKDFTCMKDGENVHSSYSCELFSPISNKKTNDNIKPLHVKCENEAKGLILGGTYIVRESPWISGRSFYELEGLEGLYDTKIFSLIDIKCDNIETDNIKPLHYNSGKFDVISFCNENNIEFWCGNVIKYCVRAGKKDKDKEVQDLRKAMEYIQRRIDFIENKWEQI